MSRAASTASHAAHESKRQASPWVERLARAGYAGKGITYVLVGVLAAMAAFSGTGGAEGSKGALASVADGTVGRILVGVVGVGLAGYSLWNFWRLFVDPEGEGNDAKGIAKRIFYGISGVLHASLAVYALTVAWKGSSGGSGSGGSGGSEGLVSMALGWPMGQWIVGAVALGILGFAIYQLYKAYKSDLSDELMFGQMSQNMRSVATYSGRAGMAARGIIFGLVAFFIMMAAINYNPDRAGGMDQALSKLGSFGWVVLAVVAIGLAAYGIYMLVKARYRRIDAS